MSDITTSTGEEPAGEGVLLTVVPLREGLVVEAQLLIDSVRRRRILTWPGWVLALPVRCMLAVPVAVWCRPPGLLDSLYKYVLEVTGGSLTSLVFYCNRRR